MSKKEDNSICFDDDFEDEFLTEPVPGGSRIVASLRPSPHQELETDIQPLW